MGERRAKGPPAVAAPQRHYCDAKDVMACLGCGEHKAYSIIKELRGELIGSGRLTPEYPKGKVPRKYFLERCMIDDGAGV